MRGKSGLRRGWCGRLHMEVAERGGDRGKARLPSWHRLREDGVLVAPHQEKTGGGFGVEGDDLLVVLIVNAMVQTNIHADLMTLGPALDRQQVDVVEGVA